MATWFDRIKQKLFPTAVKPDGAQPQSGAAARPAQADISRFVAIIKRDDFDEIESARDWVKPEHLPPLIAHYWTLTSWEHKRALIDIVQDQHHADMQPMMLDFLRAPGYGDPVDLSKAVALGHMGEEYDSFMTYYNDRKLLARDVLEVLQANGLELVEEKKPAKPTPAPPSPKPTPQSNKSAAQRLVDSAVSGSISAAQPALPDGAAIDNPIGSGTFTGCTPLMLAINQGKLEVANFLIDQGADIHFRRRNQHNPAMKTGQSALWWAASQGHLDIARKLLTHGADANAIDWHGSSPLHTAASNGQLEMVDLLVESGADIDARLTTMVVDTADGRKAVHLAATNGHALVVAYLIDVGNDPDERGGSGYSMLMVSAESNYYDQAKLLIGLGADVNAKHEGNGIYSAMKGHTPLIFAVKAGMVRMTKLLIKAGADVNYRVPASTKHDGTPIPPRTVLDFNKGKRAESIEKALLAAGARNK